MQRRSHGGMNDELMNPGTDFWSMTNVVSGAVTAAQINSSSKFIVHLLPPFVTWRVI